MSIDRIDGSGRPHPAESYGGVERPERGAASAPEASEAAADTVELSADARRLADLARAAGELPEIRADKVEPLRTAIADGSYRVDARAVARAIVESEDAFAG